ncbi:hypothetical protein DDR33_21240 [Pararcticibacter amylolyticus]|uniref:Uncharacterized protein n=1 Tax=Pararcticibacter amylolyticus TaxID=2173175 RepID=A0A2U2PB33_9SPHI|nr:hypothetical protein DDR33_21240 [Pararcticibacter amylolyticus]
MGGDFKRLGWLRIYLSPEGTFAGPCTFSTTSSCYVLHKSVIENDNINHFTFAYPQSNFLYPGNSPKNGSDPIAINAKKISFKRGS